MPATFSNVNLLQNAGEMLLRTRAFDWASTPLGKTDDWPHTLTTSVQMILNAKFPMRILWGPEYICFYNDSYIPILGDRHPSALGKPFQQVWPEIWDEISPLIERAYDCQATVCENIPLRILRNKDPETVCFTFSYSPLFKTPGEIGGMLCVCFETTFQVQLDRDRQKAVDALTLLNDTLEERVMQRGYELERAHEQLRQSQKLEAVGNLTGGVAHDFNNVLQVISGNLQLMRQNTRNDPQLHGRLNSAMAGVDRGAKLASQLLSFARKQPLQPVVLNPGKLLRDLDDMIRRAIGESLEMETVIAGGIWNTKVDRNQLENALINLAINARDAMKGQGKLTFEASNAMLDDAYSRAELEVEPGQYVLIAVSDTGCGMTAEVAARVFEPFFTTKAEGHGTGLGLAMVYGFIKQSGGHIKIYSEVGHGTTIKLYLPRSHEAEDATALVWSGPVVGGNETILVVEDDAQVRETVVALLTDLGYRVFKSPDAASALAVLESGVPVDLLFTDVVMPGELKSTELARRAVLLRPGLEVLFTSGYTENGIVHHGRLDQGVALLSKPYRREDLAIKIRHMFANRDHAKGLKTSFEPAAVPISLHHAVPKTRVTSLRILLLEDNNETRMLTAELLNQLGHFVEGCGSAETAIDLLETQHYDVLITDVTLPGMSGTEFAKFAKNNFVLGIIYASGHGPADDMEKGALWLQKPFTILELEAALSELTRRK